MAKEAKYQSGLKKSQEVDYNDVLQSMQSTNGQQRQGISRGSWARRLSRISDGGIDAHVEVTAKPNKTKQTSSTLWEVT